MENSEKLAMLEELMDLGEGTLTPETTFSSLDCWDSITRLSLIVMMDEEFGKTLNGKQVRGFETVKDVLDLMESEE